jgi:hypothetical protein
VVRGTIFAVAEVVELPFWPTHPVALPVAVRPA